MEKNYERITFVKRNYEREEDMWNDISKTIQILIKNECDVVVHDEKESVIELQFETNNYDWGCPRVEWITAEEEELLYWERTSKDNNITDEDDECDSCTISDDYSNNVSIPFSSLNDEGKCPPVEVRINHDNFD